jgi:two-component system response regulator ResD
MSDPLTCIVIDDDEGILRLMGKMLTKMGFSVSLFSTWQSGFESFEAVNYDLVILDVHMPGKDGFELARMMRHRQPRQKILIITGLDAGQVYRHLLVTGADFNDILYKPFSFDKIKLVVGEVMGMKL